MASSKVQILNELNFDALVLEATGPVLVDFSAAWCRPCKIQAAILDRVAESSNQLVVGLVDVDESPGLVRRFGIRGMPTLLAFEAGRETGRRLGLTNERGVDELLAATAQGAPNSGR